MAFKKTITALKPIIEPTSIRASVVFQWSIKVLIILSLITFSMDTLPEGDKSDLHAWIIPTLKVLEIIIITVFSAEYILRIIVADNKFRYIFGFYGLVDLIAILPFYLFYGLGYFELTSINFDSRPIRLLRILKFARYDKAIRRYRRAFSIMREELVIFSLAALGFLFMSAVGAYYFEQHAGTKGFESVVHSLWWAVVTLTTVGYGDVAPATLGGRILASFVIVIGIAIVAVPTGLVASALSAVRQEEEEKKRPAE